MPVIDVHWHLVAGIDTYQEAVQQLNECGRGGITAAVACVMDNFGQDRETMAKLVPPWGWKWLARLELSRVPVTMKLLQEDMCCQIIPFLDIRSATDPESLCLEEYARHGFGGLKLLYIPDGDRAVEISSIPRTLGISREKFQRVYREGVTQAASLGWPVLIHVDLTRDGSFARELLEDFPEVKFNIAHLGYSRKEIKSLMTEYPHCFTDLAAMAPAMLEDRNGYAAFIRDHLDRILWGSDWLFPSFTGTLWQNMQVLSAIGLTKNEIGVITWDNPKEYLGAPGAEK